MAYPIPASRGPVAGEGPYLNWIWYRRVGNGAALASTPAETPGRNHGLSVPPGRVTQTAEAEMRRAASALLAGHLSELIRNTGQPFIQSVVDLEVPRMTLGRVCLIGDAAFVARPHAAAGTAKAAADAWALAEALGQADDVPGALLDWEAGQLRLGGQLVDRSRRLGESQFQDRWVPGDHSLLFGLREPGDSCFERRPSLEAEEHFPSSSRAPTM